MCKDINSVHQELLRHLQTDGESLNFSNKFAVVGSNAERVSLAYSLIEGYNLFPAFSKDVKCDEKAQEFRQEGNLFYKRKEIANALELYTKSVAFASEKGEELALAYGNRSAALFEKKFYKECLQDITRALEHNCPENVKQKLLIRQTNAKELEIKQCGQFYHQNVPTVEEKNKNCSIQSATKSVEIRFSRDLGRHILAVQDIEIGEIIAIEKPFCSVLIDNFLSHCHKCLQLCYNLLPCPDCTQAMFCSKDCLEAAQIYHSYECRILKTLRDLNVDKMKMTALIIALFVKDEYKNIQSNFILNEKEMYYSNRYKEIHNLVSNTEHRTVSDLFKRATTAAILFYLVKNFTHFFDDATYELAFNEILLLHLQTAPCNFHEISELTDKNGVFESNEIGAGAFSFLSMFNHSCSPNVVRQCYGTSIVLRAIKTIRKGQQCFDNYGYHHAVTPKSERKNDLKKQYYFDCICEACTYDWPLYEELKPIETDISVESADISKLMKGDIECAEEVLRKYLPRMKELEIIQPNRNFSEMQEVIKQCFALLGNIKRPL